MKAIVSTLVVVTRRDITTVLVVFRTLSLRLSYLSTQVRLTMGGRLPRLPRGRSDLVANQRAQVDGGSGGRPESGEMTIGERAWTSRG